MSNRNILPLTILITCATLAILYWQLIYIPVKAEVAKFEAETQQIEIAEIKIKRLQMRYKNFEEIVDLTSESLAVAQEYLPAELNTEKFIAELYTLSENKKILINSVQVGEISENDSVQKQTIKIRLDANYVSLLNFIREILDGERLASLENFSLTSNGESSILDCELEFTILAANLE